MEKTIGLRKGNLFLVIGTLMFSLIMVLLLNKSVLACDVAVISAKASATGRPMIWKNFDCSGFWHQEAKYYQAKTSKAGGYYMLSYNNPAMITTNGSALTVQAGCNEAGLAIAASAVYEYQNLRHENNNLNTDLIQHAVEECATIADFEQLLIDFPKKHFDKAISGNFAIIDAKGGAALYELFTGYETFGYMPIMYYKFDANTGQVTDHNGKVVKAAPSNWPGYVLRTNFNTWLPDNPGVERYNRGYEILAQLKASNGLTPENIMRVLTKDVNGKQVGTASGDTNYNTNYCISRSLTRSGFVVESAAPGADPRLGIMWVAPGEPSIACYVPTFLGAKSVTPYLYMDTINSNGTMSDKDDSCLLNLAEDYRETYNELIYKYNRGNPITGEAWDTYINKVELAKVQKWTFAIEDKVYAKTREFQSILNSNPNLITTSLLKSFNDYCGEFTYKNYVAASATAVPWTYQMPSVQPADTTPPTAQISYSTTSATSGPVVATLVNESEPITITNNGGSRQYTFTQNGTFTFEFKDAAGNTGTATAKVTWIVPPQQQDTTPPTAQISYSTTSATNQDVVATLVNESEPITVTNNGGSRQYTFTQNGTFTFEFKDAAGNTGTATAKVTWIDKEAPVGTISYRTIPLIGVIATLNTNEPVTILNNYGNNTYLFRRNGTFTFMFKDAAGNTGSATAKVNWLLF